jgi:hypothetical protein
MSRALVVVNLEIAGEPEPLVNAIDHFETAIRDHFAPYVIVTKCSVSTKNSFSRPDASESGPAMASPTEGHGSIRAEREVQEDLVQACTAVLEFMDGLERGTAPDDPLLALRRRIHGPLRSKLKAALAKAGRA